ncbi:MAG: hypothetical protein WD045_07210 [Pirellulaceae bacterium]
MPIDFQCIRCWEQIQVPEGARETSATCPHCQHRQRVPGYFGASANHSASEQAKDFTDDDSTEFVPAITESDLHEMARRRLMIPVKACQWLLLVALLFIGVMGVFILGTLWETGVQRSNFSSFLTSGILVTWVIGLLLLAMKGLRHAGKADHKKRAWGGLVICTIIGFVYPLILPFAIWGLVVMTDPEVERGFKS